MIPEIEAIATSVLADIEREGLAEVIPTARAAQLTMNREGIRHLAAAPNWPPATFGLSPGKQTKPMPEK